MELLLSNILYMLASADVLALILKKNNEEDLVIAANMAIQSLREWMSRKRLELALVRLRRSYSFRGHRKRTDIKLETGNSKIIPRKYLKCLGIWVD